MHEAFVADLAWRLKVAGFLMFVTPLAAIHDFYNFAVHSGTFSVLSLLTGIGMAAISILLVWGFVHRRRPIIELFDDRLEVMLMYQFVARKRIPYDEIAGVSLSGFRLRIAKRSGRGVTIRLGSLAPETRQRVVEAIEARIGARS